MERREQIEQAADRLRGDWMSTLRELDRRREETLSPSGLWRALQRHPVALGASAAGVAALIGGGVAFGFARKRRHQRKANQLRLRALSRAWKFPERLATRAPDQPGGQLVARKVLMAALTTLGVQGSTRLMKRALAAPG